MEAEEAQAEVERAGVTAYLKDALAVLLEVRPANPLLFLSSYFSHAACPDDPANLAWYLIRACPRSRPCFQDNLYSAFLALARRGTPGWSQAGAGEGDRVLATECAALLRMLCRGLPREVADELLEQLGFAGAAEEPPEPESDTVTPPTARTIQFPEFVLVVEACLAADEALQVAARVFGDCCERCGVEAGGPTRSLPSDKLLEAMAGSAEGGSGPGSDYLETMPPPEDMRRQLAADGFDGEDAVSAQGLFVALWRLQNQGIADAGGGSQPSSTAASPTTGSPQAKA